MLCLMAQSATLSPITWYPFLPSWRWMLQTFLPPGPDCAHLFSPFNSAVKFSGHSHMPRGSNLAFQIKSSLASRLEGLAQGQLITRLGAGKEFSPGQIGRDPGSFHLLWNGVTCYTIIYFLPLQGPWGTLSPSCSFQGPHQVSILIKMLWSN